MPEDVLKWFTPVRAVGAAVNGVQKLVKRLALLAFIVVDLAVCVLSALFYWRFSKVAQLGYMIDKYELFVFLAAARAANCFIGLHAVWRRRLWWTKLFFSFLIVHALLRVSFLFPIIQVECKCDSYQQCHVLNDFVSGQGLINNPFPAPREVVEREDSKVPLVAWPDDPDTASPMETNEVHKFKEVMSELNHHPPPSAPRAAGGGAASLAEHVQVSMVGPMGHHLVRRPMPAALGSGRLHPAEGAEAPLRPSAGLQTLQLPTDSVGEVLHGNGQPGAASGAESLAPILEALHFFEASPPTIGWASGSESCKKIAEIGTHQALQLEGVLSGSKDPVDIHWSKLTPSLWQCIGNSQCSVFRVQLNQTSADKYLYHICELGNPATPVPLSSTAVSLDKDIRPMQSWYFQKNSALIKQELSGPEDAHMIFDNTFRSTTTKEGILLAQHMHRRQCHCVQASCKMWLDGNDNTRFWCYIDRSSQGACAREGHKLFYDHHKEMAWSEGPCKSVGCKCSYTPTYGGNIADAIEDKLWTNKLNYGTECDLWTHSDEELWCNVGSDTTCKDRERHIKGTPHQFWSRLPCRVSEGDQLPRAKCLDWTRAAEAVVLLAMLMDMVMLTVVFKFILNRCGDAFEFEDQFVVVVSTDEGSSEEAGSDRHGDAEPDGARFRAATLKG